MANATDPLVGRSVGHDWAVLMATSGHFYWPPTGRNSWPLTLKSESANLTVRSVIADLPEPAFFSRTIKRSEIPFHENHWTMRPVSIRFSQPGGANRSGRSFRRLEWDKPSPTVAYGHREIHVHPDGRRRLSIFEAMLLQGFPPDFVLEGTLSAQVEQVSNAVPPPLAESLATAIRKALFKVGEPRT